MYTYTFHHTTSCFYIEYKPGSILFTSAAPELQDTASNEIKKKKNTSTWQLGSQRERPTNQPTFMIIDGYIVAIWLYNY